MGELATLPLGTVVKKLEAYICSLSLCHVGMLLCFVSGRSKKQEEKKVISSPEILRLIIALFKVLELIFENLTFLCRNFLQLEKVVKLSLFF